MAGRIECYMHSDNVTKNKAAAMVRVDCQTDFAAKTEDFVEFVQEVAKYACGFQTTDPAVVFDMVPSLAEDLAALKAELKEDIVVAEIKLMTLGGEPRFAGGSVNYRQCENVATGRFQELARKKREQACQVPGCDGVQDAAKSGSPCGKCGHDHEV